MTDLNTAGYQTRRSWSDEHLTAVKAALGKRFFHVSNLMQDTRFGCDLCIPTLNLAVRVRQMKYGNYMDFTIRTSGGGNRSEYAKLLDSKVAPDFLVYAYSLDSKQLAAAYLIDLKQWRQAVLTGESKPLFRRNKDGSHFVAFPFYDLRYAGRNANRTFHHFVEQIV